MARKRPDRSETDKQALEQAAEDYRQAASLAEAVLEAACHFGDEEGFDHVWEFAQARLARSKRDYVIACIQGGWFTK